MKDFKTMTVGDIAAEDYKYAKVFEHYGLDFCCNGFVPLTEACEKANINVDNVIAELNGAPADADNTVDFKTWPLDLLVDYVLKRHHRYIKHEGPEIIELLDKVCDVHGQNHPELFQVRDEFNASIEALLIHLQKEEQMLFPYIQSLVEAEQEGTKVDGFHCGSVESPINVMMAEHDAEGERYRRISKLTNGYTAPADACNSYKLVLTEIHQFEDDLHHHIHLENNIIFPRAIALEKKLM